MTTKTESWERLRNLELDRLMMLTVNWWWYLETGRHHAIYRRELRTITVEIMQARCEAMGIPYR